MKITKRRVFVGAGAVAGLAIVGSMFGETEEQTVESPTPRPTEVYTPIPTVGVKEIIKSTPDATANRTPITIPTPIPSPTNTPSPTPTPLPTWTPSPAPSPTSTPTEQELAQYPNYGLPSEHPSWDEMKKVYRKISYRDLVRNFEDLEFQRHLFVGEVLQVIEEDSNGDQDFLVLVDNEGLDVVALVSYDGPRLLAGDRIEFVAAIARRWYEYTTVMGQAMRVPRLFSYDVLIPGGEIWHNGKRLAFVESDVYNCGDLLSQAQAQSVLMYNSDDPNKLDRDKDGIACESLSAPYDKRPVKRD